VVESVQGNNRDVKSRGYSCASWSHGRKTSQRLGFFIALAVPEPANLRSRYKETSKTLFVKLRCVIRAVRQRGSRDEANFTHMACRSGLGYRLLACAPAMAGFDPAFQQPALGPGKAKGVVVWSHGRSINAEDSQSPTPAYLHALGDNGWDGHALQPAEQADFAARQRHQSRRACGG